MEKLKNVLLFHLLYFFILTFNSGGFTFCYFFVVKIMISMPIPCVNKVQTSQNFLRSPNHSEEKLVCLVPF